MNPELTEIRMMRVNEIYDCNLRSIPNAFKIRKFLNLAYLERYQFGEFVSEYKKCNGGYF